MILQLFKNFKNVLSLWALQKPVESGLLNYSLMIPDPQYRFTTCVKNLWEQKYFRIQFFRALKDNKYMLYIIGAHIITPHNQTYQCLCSILVNIHPK